MQCFGKPFLVQIAIALSHKTFQFLHVVIRKSIGHPKFPENSTSF